MKISDIFSLGKSQYELDFVDIDLSTDIPLFIDPYFLSQGNDSWSIEASNTIRDYFQQLIRLLHNGSFTKAKRLFSHLNEPNETCLGLSKGTPQGRGIGRENADTIFASLLESKAVKTGIVEDIEDCRVFVPGIDKDKSSDMTTNIIRKHLIEYTQYQCRLWGIPLQGNVPSGYFWDRLQNRWSNHYTEMLIVDGRKILLTPKGIVSYSNQYTAQKYTQHFVLNFLQNENIRLDTSLVQRKLKKDGSELKWVTKNNIIENEPKMTKDYLVEFTIKHPDIFKKFRQDTARNISSLSNQELLPFDLNSIVDHLINELRVLPSGNTNATLYHRLIYGILELIFYPNLIFPRIEREIHEGRKRIDIIFDNAAHTGFFHHLHDIHNTPSQYIFIECKNYSSDVENPELDQLSGRFSPNRGKFGLLLCRTIKDMDTLIDRCSDTYNDHRGTIIPLADDDLISILDSLKIGVNHPEEELLNNRLRNIELS